jgi:xanthine dehydrogenase D subunit
MTTRVEERRLVGERETIGSSARRPDAVPKVSGTFLFSSDLHADDMLWGVTVRSPHVRARIRAIDTEGALAMPGVRAVLTHVDVPGRKTFGTDVADQPVLAWEEVRYRGEAVAVVAAENPELAKRAARAVVVDYEPLPPLVDPDLALADEAPRLHPGGNVVRHIPVRHGDPAASAEVVVRGEYEIGMQDQAFLGPESGLAVPDGGGGVDLYVASQGIHIDQEQMVESLALPADMVRVTLAGVGGAFGAREDISMHIHACLLALKTGRPIKMVYGRQESFVGHVHRHPARLRYEHGADRTGRLVYVKARIVLDGGAYASSSIPACRNVASFAAGPYVVPNARVDAYAVYTNNPPCGAMRGFGAVQACFAYESQMDKLANALDMDPVELRRLNAVRTGDRLITGQPVLGPVPVSELLRRVKNVPLPANREDGPTRDLRDLPGGVANATHGEGLRRGVGYAVGIKSMCYAEGSDDFSTARVRLYLSAHGPAASVHTAGAEIGQGLVTVQAQIVRTELGVDDVTVMTADTSVGPAGSSSSSRQTYMTGGAVKVACEAVREQLFARASLDLDAEPGDLAIEEENVVSRCSGRRASLADLLRAGAIDETREYHHRKTEPLNPVNGQGDAHVTFAYAAHRAVVDVDVELGLVRVVEIATAQDVGRAINPQAVEGQIEGGISQGLGLALMEEIQLRDGVILNDSFTDYLIPTILDMPPVRLDILELADPNAPYGLKGVGEPPTVSSTPAVIAAVRDATGAAVRRVPLRPDDIVLAPEPELPTGTPVGVPPGR